MNNNLSVFRVIWSTIFLLTLLALNGLAQDNQDEDLTQMREIRSEDFTKNRPVATKDSAKKKLDAVAVNQTAANKSSANKKVYKLNRKQMPRRTKTATTAATRPKTNQTDKLKTAVETSIVEQLGITMWRLRPERSSDTGARLLTQEAPDVRLVAERVSLDTVFRPKDKVRISIESPRAGYLYIIDREMFAGGKLGTPYLIFPSLKTRGGENQVSAGVPVEIPAQSDEPFYFEITPLDDNYVGELITVILSPSKISNLQLANEPIQLKSSLVERWEDEWEQAASIFELDKNDNKTYTEEEKQAGDGARQLTQNSPAPQNMVAVKVPNGKTFLVSFAMNVNR